MTLTGPQLADVWSRVVKVIRREGLTEYVKAWPEAGLPPPRTLSQLRDRVSRYHHHTHIHLDMDTPPVVTTGRNTQRRVPQNVLERAWRSPPEFEYDSVAKLGLIRIFTCSGNGLGKDAFDAFQARVSSAIRSHMDAWRSRGMCGLILDLRKHHGGSFYSASAGFLTELDGVPLFAWAKSAAGARRERAWLFAGPKWTRNLRDERERAAVKRALAEPPGTVPLASPTLRVAVLLGPKTASSGEIVGALFVGKAGVRCFGQPTAGALQINQEVNVGHGVGLVLTMQRVALVGSGGQLTDRLEPDVLTRTPLQSARAWLRSECHGTEPAMK